VEEEAGSEVGEEVRVGMGVGVGVEVEVGVMDGIRVGVGVDVRVKVVVGGIASLTIIDPEIACAPAISSRKFSGMIEIKPEADELSSKRIFNNTTSPVIAAAEPAKPEITTQSVNGAPTTVEKPSVPVPALLMLLY